MREEYNQSKVSAAIRMEFMTKRMNRPVEDTRLAVASYEDRLATNQKVPESMKGSEVIGG